MKIIKRSGSEVTFDLQKIINAINGANSEVKSSERLTDRQVRYAAENVADRCEEAGHTVSVEEIQDMVEDELMALDRFEVARRYIIYRYVQGLKRQKNTTDDKILSLIECNNEEVKQENSNKNPTVNSVQRDYMAGEVSKDLTQRVLLPAEVVEAHNEGIIHFHDSDYFAQHMHNCDLVNLEDMLQNGTVISGTLIERPPQLLHRLQYRHADHRPGRLLSVWRPVHLAHAPRTVRRGQPSEDPSSGRGGARRAWRGCPRGEGVRGRGDPPAR